MCCHSSDSWTVGQTCHKSDKISIKSCRQVFAQCVPQLIGALGRSHFYLLFARLLCGEWFTLYMTLLILGISFNVFGRNRAGVKLFTLSKLHKESLPLN